MRFVRITLNHSRDAIHCVFQQETPFQEGGFVLHDSERLETIDLGAVDEHDWTDRNGAPCLPCLHILHRLEDGGMKPAAVLSGKVAGTMAASLSLKEIHDVPCTMDGIAKRLRARGPSAVPERVAHWLEFMEVLSGDEMDAAGLPRLTMAAAIEFDKVRAARDPTHRPRANVFKRRTQERAALRKGK